MTDNGIEIEDKAFQGEEIHEDSGSEMEIDSDLEHDAPGLLLSMSENITDAKKDAIKLQSKESSHHPTLPLTRIRKIMKADPELHKCSQEAVLATAIATVNQCPVFIYVLC